MGASLQLALEHAMDQQQQQQQQPQRQQQLRLSEACSGSSRHLAPRLSVISTSSLSRKGGTSRRLSSVPPVAHQQQFSSSLGAIGLDSRGFDSHASTSILSNAPTSSADTSRSGSAENRA